MVLVMLLAMLAIVAILAGLSYYYRPFVTVPLRLVTNALSGALLRERSIFGFLLWGVSLIALPVFGVWLAWGQGFFSCLLAALLGVAAPLSCVRRRRV